MIVLEFPVNTVEAVSTVYHRRRRYHLYWKPVETTAKCTLHSAQCTVCKHGTGHCVCRGSFLKFINSRCSGNPRMSKDTLFCCILKFWMLVFFGHNVCVWILLKGTCVHIYVFTCALVCVSLPVCYVHSDAVWENRACGRELWRVPVSIAQCAGAATPVDSSSDRHIWKPLTPSGPTQFFPGKISTSSCHRRLLWQDFSYLLKFETYVVSQ